MNAFWSRLHDIANNDPNSTALLGNGILISYKELSNSVNTYARSLISLGVKSGDRVALVATKTVESVTVFLSTLQIGAIAVPINPLLKSRQRGHIIRHCGAKTLFCAQHELFDFFIDDKLPLLETVILIEGIYSDPDQLNLGSSTSKTVMELSDFIRLKPENSTHHYAGKINNDLGAILYTSGSTGTPKGVMLTRSNLHYGALSISEYLQNTSQDRILALLPLSFDYGLSQLTSAVHTGACLVLHDYILPKGVINAVKEHDVTGIPAVPHLWDQLMALKWPKLPNLRYATSTGGILQEPTIRAIQERLPDTTLFSMYGFTEAFRATYLLPSQLESKPHSIGIAVPFANVLVVDENGKQTAPFEKGEIIQCGKLVTAGYWGDIEGTKKKFHTRSMAPESDKSTVYAWSGDMGYIDDEGYLYFVSRHDDLVKLNGHRISPAEIERNLITCEWVNEVCIICVPDTRFGHTAIAFVVTPDEVTTAELAQWATRHLPSFMIPSQWYVMKNLPASANNKVDRNLLLQKYQNHYFD